MEFGFRKSVKSLLQLASASVAVKFLGVFMLALLTRYLTKEELALLPVYEMLAALSGMFFGFGLQPTFMRLLPAKYAEDYDGARGLIYSGGLLLTGGSIVFACGVYFLADWLSPILFKGQDFVHLVKIISLGFFFISLKNVSSLVLWSMQRFDKISLIQVTTSIGRATFGIGFMLIWGVKGLAMGLVMNEVLCASVSVFFIRDILIGPRVPLHPIWNLVKQSLPFYFEGFLIYFRSQGDNWIVATVLGPSTMAVYFVAKRLPAMMLMFIDSLDKVVTSEISKRKNNPDEIISYTQQIFLINAHVTLPGTIFIMGLTPLFILVVAGQAYMASVVPCLILCAVQPIQALHIPLSRSIFVIHPPMTRVILTVIESVILLLSLYILVPLLAVNGIALSRVVAAGAALLMALLVLKRTIGLGLPWGQAALSTVFSAAMAGTMLGLQSWNGNIFFTAAYGAIGAVVFLILVNIFNSKAYYEVLNTVLPFRINDPVGALRGMINSRGRSS
jgi:O-antigen/teichoic acid export membrane protein